MFDFHTHILPAIDDGSKNVTMSLTMLQESSNQGVTDIVLTPHFYADHDSPQEFLQRRMNAANQLEQQLGQLRICPQLLLGAEVHYYRGMGNSAELQNFCIGQSNFVLIEMPFERWSSYMLRDIENVHSRLGLQIIIAHIERYLSLEPPENITALKTGANALFQANADFFLQRSTRRKAIKMLERGEIQLLASDCHNLTTRAPNLGDAVAYIEKRIGNTGLRRIEQRSIQIFRAAGAKVQGGAYDG